MGEYQIFWGEAHDNTYQHDPMPYTFEETLNRAEEHLDFYCAAYYTAWYKDAQARVGKPDPALILEGWKPPELLVREWAEVQEHTRRRNAPGRFVIFPGFEWQGDGRSGDHNVFLLREGASIPRVETAPELYDALRGSDAIAIPHHIGYRVGVRGKNWDYFDETLTPFTEIFSVHGCSETDEEWVGLRNNTHMGPGFHGGSYQAALDRGLHVGAICSTDNWGAMPGHYGRGCMACLATELTRESLWEAFKARRVYGVTGDRIELDFRIGQAQMGEVVPWKGGARHVRVKVRGWDAIDRIELLRNNRVIATECHQGAWALPVAGHRDRFVFRLEAGWGPKPSEIDLPERHWQGEVRVEGGRFTAARPCWVSPGQSRPELHGDRASFRLRSDGSTVIERTQNAHVFEFEADPDAPMVVRLNGIESSGTVRDFAGGARELWYRDECVRMLADRYDLEPDSPSREDIYHHYAYKAKLHRPIPAAGFTAMLELDDEEELDGETHYRVRVEQRNGQRAWSSPIWFQPRC